MNTVEIRPDGLYLNGEKTRLLSGELHYFRVLPGGWRKRMKLMKDFSLTTITTYVPWNLHEPKEGEFSFEGLTDLPAFLKMAKEEGLYVWLRLSPYMCSEWEMGGLPSWLLKDRNLCVRSSDPEWMRRVKNYNKVLCEKVRPYQFTEGGPVILLGLENEYGSFGSDKEYLKMLRDDYRENGLVLPFTSANGADPFKFLNGTLPENWNGVDAQAVPGGIRDLEILDSMKLHKPLMCGEAWVGRIQFTGRSFSVNAEAEDCAAYFKKALEKDAAVNLYMFCGGTNFGFMNGSLDHSGKDQFTPLCTSYDYDAPVSEEGTPRDKFFAMRDVLDEALGKEKRPHVAPAYRAQTLPPIRFTEAAGLLESAPAIAEKHVITGKPWCMEDLDQDYGFILYKTFIPYADARKYHLKIDGLADRATIYLNGVYQGSMMREAENPDIAFSIPEGGAELAILVENCGRIDYGYNIYDRKGILGCVRFAIEQPNGSYLFNLANCMGFDTYTLPMRSLDGLTYAEKLPEKGLPAVYRAGFKAEAGVDTFLDMEGWHRGCVWVNGFNLGRYTELGPQRTLYVPGELLKEENVIEVLELHEPKDDLTVGTLDHAILDAPADEADVKFELK